MSDELNKFIDDYNKYGASYVADKLGVPRTIVGNGAALLGALGFDISARSPSHKKIDFDGKVAEDLFDKGVSLKDISAHLNVKKISVSSYLRRIGKIKKPVSLAEALGNAGSGDVAKAA